MVGSAVGAVRCAGTGAVVWCGVCVGGAVAKVWCHCGWFLVEVLFTVGTVVPRVSSGSFHCNAPWAAWYLRSKLTALRVCLDSGSWVEISSDETYLPLLLVGTVFSQCVGPWLAA